MKNKKEVSESRKLVDLFVTGFCILGVVGLYQYLIKASVINGENVDDLIKLSKSELKEKINKAVTDERFLDADKLKKLIELKDDSKKKPKTKKSNENL